MQTNHQMTATEISDAHIKLINSSWDYHPDPEHTMASISEPKVQAFADAIKVNAPFSTMHRDYRSANDSTIKVFDDRIEFFNPGALLDDLTVEKIKTGNYKSHLRNKQVAPLFKELELIEKYGSGVRRVIDTFVAYGLPEPEFEATQGAMAVTVFKATAEIKGRAQPESQPESDLTLDAKVLQLLAKAPMSKRDISAALGQKEVSGQLNKVVRTLLTSGLIEVTIPDKINSRLQQYRLTVQR